MSELGAEQGQRLDAGLGSELKALDIEPGERGPAEPAQSVPDRAVDSKLDTGRDLQAGPEIGTGVAEPGESGPAEPESGPAAGYGPAGDMGLGRSSIESPAGMMSDTSGALASAEIAEPGEAGPAEAVEEGLAGDVTAALHGVEAAARDLSANAAKAVEALPQEQRTEGR